MNSILTAVIAAKRSKPFLIVLDAQRRYQESLRHFGIDSAEARAAFGEWQALQRTLPSRQEVSVE
jgi:hypothetical protein